MGAWMRPDCWPKPAILPAVTRQQRKWGKARVFERTQCRLSPRTKRWLRVSAAALTFAEKESDPVLRCGLYHGIALGLLKARGVEAPSYRWIVPLY